MKSLHDWNVLFQKIKEKNQEATLVQSATNNENCKKAQEWKKYEITK